MGKYRSSVILNGAVYDVCTDPTINRLVVHIHTIVKQHGYATVNMVDNRGISPIGEAMYKIVDPYTCHTVGHAVVKAV
jgi:hypothetical protein